jgi:CubicO group peptidase (beta-lactamase class C family)
VRTARDNRRVNARRLTAGAVLALSLAACRSGPSSPTSSGSGAGLTPVQSTAEWPAAAPETAGLDAARLASLAGRIRSRSYGAITSLLIVRDGSLVVEEYFNGTNPVTPLTMQSVSKSVTSLLAGIAIDQGRLGLDDRVTAAMRRYEPIANADERKRAMTVRDLLTMRTGLEWNEDNYAVSPLQALNGCYCDWLRFVLDWPMRDQPGTRWEYVSGGVILLGGIIGEATGQRLDRFADQYLFGPMDVQGAYWYSGLPDGLPHSGGGLYLRPRDMAKIGQLVLDEGRWRGRQIVSASWIRASTARTIAGVRTFGSHPVDYGYLWWTMNPSDLVTASGSGGQWIFVSPRDRLVVASTGANEDGRWTSAADFLYSDILPALRR